MSINNKFKLALKISAVFMLCLAVTCILIKTILIEPFNEESQRRMNLAVQSVEALVEFYRDETTNDKKIAIVKDLERLMASGSATAASFLITLNGELSSADRNDAVFRILPSHDDVLMRGLNVLSDLELYLFLKEFKENGYASHDEGGEDGIQLHKYLTTTSKLPASHKEQLFSCLGVLESRYSKEINYAKYYHTKGSCLNT